MERTGISESSKQEQYIGTDCIIIASPTGRSTKQRDLQIHQTGLIRPGRSPKQAHNSRRTGSIGIEQDRTAVRRSIELSPSVETTVQPYADRSTAASREASTASSGVEDLPLDDTIVHPLCVSKRWCGATQGAQGCPR